MSNKSQMSIEKGVNKLARSIRRVVCRLIKRTAGSNAAFAVQDERKMKFSMYH